MTRYASFLPQAEVRARNLYDFMQYHEKVCGSWVECMPLAKKSMTTTISEKDILGLLATTPFNVILQRFGMVKTWMAKVTCTTWRTLCGMEFACYFSRSQEEEQMTDLKSNPAVILGDIEYE